MWRKGLVALAALLLWAWGIFAISYATSRPTEGLLGVSVIIGATFTCFVLAILVILLLALLPTMGWG
jgi:hypothetical protein